MEHPLMPFNRNGVLFPCKIDGLYALLSRPNDSGHTPFGDIILSYSPDLTYWGKHRLVMQRQPRSWWQSTKIGAGPVPIETRVGWLLFYHGVITNCNGFVYSMGAALLDMHDPASVLFRTRDYLVLPECSTSCTLRVFQPGGSFARSGVRALESERIRPASSVPYCVRPAPITRKPPVRACTRRSTIDRKSPRLT